MIPQSGPGSRKREKTVLSCSFCRRRKLRCDRQHPCTACERRGKPEECSYASSEQERKNAVDYRPHNRPQKAQQRLARLERLVTEMRDREENAGQHPDTNSQITGSPTPRRPSAPTTDEHVSSNFAKLSLDHENATYTGSSHWVTVFETIQNLKDELADEESSADFNAESLASKEDLPALPPTKVSLLANTQCLPKEHIMAMIPSRKETDRHVANFFNAYDIGPFLIYRNQFLVEYEKFWANPPSAPNMWVALLFGMLSTSAFLKQRELVATGSSGTEIDNIMEKYRILSIQSLILSDYVRPTRYTMEALLVHFSANQSMGTDTNIENWVLIGVVIRIAMRMGLHRDPSHWPRIRPLQAEIRRRHWMALYQVDFLTSASVGLPRHINNSQCDTRVPRHLLEQDLTPEDTELPPERPPTDENVLLYMIQRHRVIQVVAEIYDMTEASSPSLDTIDALEAKLKAVVETIPSRLIYSSSLPFVTDNPALMLHRIFMDILINKAIYLLHRRSFMKDAVGEDNIRSSRRCIDAALTISKHQQRLIEETQPGGLVSSYRWKVVPTINHEFMQATMMLCLALSRFSDGIAPFNQPGVAYRRDEILEALMTAQGTWEMNSNTSMEAQRAAKVIASVLKKDANTPNSSASLPSDDFVDEMFGIPAPGFLDTFGPWDNMTLDPTSLSMDGEFPEFTHRFDGFGPQ